MLEKNTFFVTDAEGNDIECLVLFTHYDEKFEKNNNVLHLHKRILPIDVRRIEMQFEEICFYWMQPAEVAVNYIKEHYEKEYQEETLLEKIDEPDNRSVSLKQYKLSRGEKLC